MDKQRLIPLDLVIPVSFLKSCGCCGRSGYIGLWWMKSKDKLISEDGKCCIAGMKWVPWAVYWEEYSQYMEQLLDRGIDFGSSSRQASHMLIVERETRRTYAIEIESGHQFLNEKLTPRCPDEINNGFQNIFLAPDERIRHAMIPLGLRNEKQVVNAFHSLRQEIGIA